MKRLCLLFITIPIQIYKIGFALDYHMALSMNVGKITFKINYAPIVNYFEFRQAILNNHKPGFMTGRQIE